MIKYICIPLTSLLLINFAPSALAGGDNNPAGSRSASMGNASVGLHDIWSCFNNQAGLARLSRAEFGSYFEDRFLLKELRYSAIAVCYPVKSGTFGLSGTYFGYSAYNESKIGLAYAQSFGKFLSFGLQFDYNMVRLGDNYGTRNFVTFEAGMLADVTPALTIGAHISNPANVKLAGYTDERVPVIFRVGAAYTISDNLIVVAETSKNSYTKATLNAGIEYKIAKYLFLRGGISSGPSTYAFGCGFLINDLVIDIGTSYHPVLGYSPQASLSFKL